MCSLFNDLFLCTCGTKLGGFYFATPLLCRLFLQIQRATPHQPSKWHQAASQRRPAAAACSLRLRKPLDSQRPAAGACSLRLRKPLFRDAPHTRSRLQHRSNPASGSLQPSASETFIPRRAAPPEADCSTAATQQAQR